MDVDGEPSASEPTFTPPGSLPCVEQVIEELPVEEAQLLGIDLDVLEQQQLSDTTPPREHWADQQDPPQGEVADTNLLGLDEGEGAAPGAPVEEVVQGLPSFNILHGESPPRLIEPDTPAEHTPRVKEEVAALLRLHGASPTRRRKKFLIQCCQ